MQPYRHCHICSKRLATSSRDHVTIASTNSTITRNNASGGTHSSVSGTHHLLFWRISRSIHSLYHASPFSFLFIPCLAVCWVEDMQSLCPCHRHSLLFIKLPIRAGCRELCVLLYVETAAASGPALASPGLASVASACESQRHRSFVDSRWPLVRWSG